LKRSGRENATIDDGLEKVNIHLHAGKRNIPSERPLFRRRREGDREPSEREVSMPEE